MVKFFIYALIVTALVIGLSMLIQRDAGYILVSYDQLSIESSLWAGLLAIVLLLLLIYWLIRLVLKVRYSGRSLQHWREGRQARRNEVRITQGLIQFMEGKWKESEKTFAAGAERSPTPLLSYLMAARASAAAGDRARSEEYLQRAEAATPEARLAIGLTQSEMQLRRGEYESCLANLNRLRTEQPDNSLVMAMLAEVYQGLGDWENLQQLLPELRKQQALSAEKLAEFERDCHRELLKNSQSSAVLEQRWGALPKPMKKDPQLIAVHAQSLAGLGQQDEAESLLRTVLKKNWSSELAALYGKVRASEPDKQLAVAEGWLKQHPENPELLLALGRICSASEQWQKAKDYFSSSLAIQPDSAAYAELGAVLAQLGEAEASREQIQKALSLEPAATKSVPALPPAAD